MNPSDGNSEAVLGTSTKSLGMFQEIFVLQKKTRSNGKSMRKLQKESKSTVREKKCVVTFLLAKDLIVKSDEGDHEGREPIN